MSALQIKKLQSGAFEHVDSIDGIFFLGRFSFKQEFNHAFLVEAYGAKRRQYLVNEIEIFDYLGTAETFTNWTDLINRLTELGYSGIDTNLIPFSLTASNFGEFSKDLTTNDSIVDSDLITYTDISDTNKQKKTTWLNIKAKLKTYFDTLYQPIGGGGGGSTSFKGNWNAETNIPTLANGTGTTGDEYIVTSSFYRFGEIFLINDFIIYDGSVWKKSRNNNEDIATRYPISYINTNDGTGTQQQGEADYVENAGAINAAGVITDYVLIDGVNTYLNSRRFRTQALANSTTTLRNTSWNRIKESQGFYIDFSVINSDASINLTSRGNFGYSSQGFGNIDPSGLTGYFFGIGFDSADTNIHVFSKTSSAANTGVTKQDTGWLKTNTERINAKFFREIGSSKVFFILYNDTTGTYFKGMFTFNPSGIGITRNFYKGSGTSPIATGFQHLHTNLKTSV